MEGISKEKIIPKTAAANAIFLQPTKNKKVSAPTANPTHAPCDLVKIIAKIDKINNQNDAKKFQNRSGGNGNIDVVAGSHGFKEFRQ